MTPGVRVAVVGRGDPALAQRLQDLVPHRDRPAGLPVAEHRDGHAGVPAHRRGPRTPLGRVVGAHAEDPLLLGQLAHPVVDRGIVGDRDDVPRALEVGVLERPLGAR